MGVCGGKSNISKRTEAKEPNEDILKQSYEEEM